MGRAMFSAARRGELPHGDVIPMLWNFTGPAMDTTISAIGHAVWRFAAEPEQWTQVRQDRSLIPSAILEALSFGYGLHGCVGQSLRSATPRSRRTPFGQVGGSASGADTLRAQDLPGRHYRRRYPRSACAGPAGAAAGPASPSLDLMSEGGLTEPPWTLTSWPSRHCRSPSTG
jgi:hypothetical protein